ncbi:MAG: nitrate reductase cytochrome c-type subunit [Burkholderiales bacterium]
MKTRPFNLIATAACVAVFSLGASAQEASKAKVDPNTPVEARSNADTFRVERDRSNIPREYVQQPPLVPHSIRDYRITQNFNKCMDCHSWTKYQQANATKVSITHFKDRDGTELGNISPRRYFCTQCHVPQTETRPLVENTFKRAEGLRR